MMASLRPFNSQRGPSVTRSQNLKGCTGYNTNRQNLIPQSSAAIVHRRAQRMRFRPGFDHGSLQFLFKVLSQAITMAAPRSWGWYMRRRDFFGVLSGAATWPVAARAQERMRRIGVLMGMTESDAEGRALSTAFRDGLEKLGWTESRNIRIDTRWTTPDDVESIQRFAKELVALQPDVILSHVSRTTAALLQETRTIPIIFVIVSDPIGNGFVASFPQPGGNATGFVVTEGSLGSKWLELLKEVAPRVGRAAFIFNPATAPYAGFYLAPFKASAASLAVDAIVAPIHDRTELDAAIAAIAREPNGGLIVMPDPFMRAHRKEITSLAARYHIPAVYPYR